MRIQLALQRIAARSTPLKTLALSVGLVSATMAGLPAVASAVGFGPFFEFSHGNGELDLDDIFDSPVTRNQDLDFETDKFAVGFAVDTNVAANRLFNYRLSLGFQRTRRDFDTFRLNLPQVPATVVFDFDNLKASGFTFNNEFGFGLLRTDYVRVWAGPSLRLGVDVYDTDVNDFDIIDVSVGFGVSFGVNIHAGPLVSVALTTGYQYTYIGEIIAYEDQFGNEEAESLDGFEHVVKAGVTVFFRTPGDRF